MLVSGPAITQRMRLNGFTLFRERVEFGLGWRTGRTELDEVKWGGHSRWGQHARKQRPERVWDGLGAVGKRAGKAEEWKEIRLYRMELHSGSSRQFSLLRGLSTLRKWKQRRTARSWVKDRTTDRDSEKISRARGLGLSPWRLLRRRLPWLWQCEGMGASPGHGRGRERNEKE